MVTAAHAIARAPAARERPRVRDLGRNSLVILGLILLVALSLRVYGALNPPRVPGDDSAAYMSIAKALFEDGRFGSAAQASPTDWSPGAPLLYGALYYLVGGVEPGFARLFVALLGTAMVLFVFLIGRRVAGVAVGLVAAAIVATYPTYIDNNTQLLSEPVAGFFLCGAVLGILWAADRRRVLAWAVPGLLFGYLILTRPEYQAITAIFAVLVAYRVFRDRGWRFALVSTLVLLVAAGLVVAPWMIRNRLVLDKWVPVSTGGGKALFIATYLPGNGRHFATKRDLMWRYLGVPKEPIDAKRFRAQSMTPLLNRVAEKYPDMSRDEALGRIGKENMRKYLREQPVAYMKMTFWKAWNVWRRGSSLSMRAVPWIIYHRILLVLAIVGFVLAFRPVATRWSSILIAMPAVAITGLGALLLAVPRRQVPLMPLVLIFSAIAIVAAVRRVRESRARSAV